MLTQAGGVAEAFVIDLAYTGRTESSLFLPLRFGALMPSVAFTEAVLAVGGSSGLVFLLRLF